MFFIFGCIHFIDKVNMNWDISDFVFYIPYGFST